MNQFSSLTPIISKKNKETKNGVYIVGICGGQGSGKTKLSDALAKRVYGCRVIEEKHFFKGNKVSRKLSQGDEDLMGDYDCYPRERKVFLAEFNDPFSYDYSKISQILKDLKNNNKEVEYEKFIEKGEPQDKKMVKIDPKIHHVIIIEGYFLFRNEDVRNLLDLKIYVEIDDDIRASRLLINESTYLKNSLVGLKTFFKIYEKYIKPAYEQYIAPTKQYAKMILTNYQVKEDGSIKNEKDDTLDMLVIHLKNISAQLQK
jgi:uridine kinase